MGWWLSTCSRIIAFLGVTTISWGDIIWPSTSLMIGITAQSGSKYGFYCVTSIGGYFVMNTAYAAMVFPGHISRELITFYFLSHHQHRVNLYFDRWLLNWHMIKRYHVYNSFKTNCIHFHMCWSFAIFNCGILWLVTAHGHHHHDKPSVDI